MNTKKSIINRLVILTNIVFAIFIASCNKPVIVAPETQGFFLGNFELKKAKIPQSVITKQDTSTPTATVSIFNSDTIAFVSKYIYGHNANIYMSQMVNEPLLIDQIKKLSPNIIRFPGGNISNVYFWDKKKGERPEDIPDTIFVDNGGRVENIWFGRNDSSFTISLDNYYKMLEMTNSTGVISVNVGYSRYGTSKDPIDRAAHYAADWVRYDNGRTKFWEVGNENYGPWVAGFKIDTNLNNDGQPEIIDGKLYARIYKVFADSMRAAAKEIGSEIKLGVVTIESKRDSNWYNPVEAQWNEGFFKTAGDDPDFFVIHSYFTPYNDNSKPDVILHSPLHEVPAMVNYLKEMCIEYGIKMKPVALTEWNIFAVGSKQFVSYINGMHATLVLGELIKNKLGMANRWNFANAWENGNDHGIFSKGDEPGVPLWTPRPPYHYMYYFQKYFGNYMIKSTSDNNDIICYASLFDTGETGIVIVNIGTEKQTVKIQLNDYMPGSKYYYHSLIGGDDNGEFSLNVIVNEQKSEEIIGGPDVSKVPAYAIVATNGIVIPSPGYSVQYVMIEKK